MTVIEIKNAVEYWQITAEHDYEAMLGLFGIKRYSESLFFGHIVLEKILKALVVKNIKEQAPKIHDLVRLHELADAGLPAEQIALLKEINNFNISTRYPDYKFRFYKICTKDFTEKYLRKIKNIYKILCLILK